MTELKEKRQVIDGKLFCRKCKKLKLLSFFWKSDKYPLGYHHYCIECNREKYIRRRRKRGRKLALEFKVILNNKFCNGCKTLKDVELFGKNKTKKTGYSNFCKKCMTKKNYEWLRKKPNYVIEKRAKLYGLTLLLYNSKYNIQNGKCLICKTNEKLFKYKLFIDHNHSTGKVRGLLCHNCNTALGLLKLSKLTINNLIQYIDKYNILELI